MTRRAALARFAVVFGGLTTAGPLLEAARAIAAPPAGFTNDRQRLFAALAKAYDKQKGSVVDIGRRDLVAELAARYTAAGDGYRAAVDALLDGVQQAPKGARFGDLSLDGRRQALRSWNSLTEPDDALMKKRRPDDVHEPDNVADSNARALAAMQAFRKTLTPEQLAIDPTTLLPSFVPRPSGEPTPITSGDPLGTEVRILRELRYGSYQLVASFFSEEPVIPDQVVFA